MFKMTANICVCTALSAAKITLKQELINAFNEGIYMQHYYYMRFTLTNVTINVHYIINNINSFADQLFDIKKDKLLNCSALVSGQINKNIILNCDVELGGALQVNAILVCKNIIYRHNVNWTRIHANVVTIKCPFYELLEYKTVIKNTNKLYIKSSDNFDTSKVVKVCPNIELFITKFEYRRVCCVVAEMIKLNSKIHFVKCGRYKAFQIPKKYMRIAFNFTH